ncbi:MAG: hypothetical protein KAW67_00585 [Candidatus Eisenbacteria sp.]|nr:hypothetical protein [Candidatus Eisenbacteria bacterium]
MSGYTIGDFAGALNGIAESLSGIAEELNQCDLDAVIDNTPGRTAICQGPIFGGGMCIAAIKDPFKVRDLVETVEGLRDWVADVQSKLANYDATASLDSGAWPASDEEASA